MQTVQLSAKPFLVTKESDIYAKQTSFSFKSVTNLYILYSPTLANISGVPYLFCDLSLQAPSQENVQNVLQGKSLTTAQLSTAAKDGRLADVRTLLAAGADVDGRDPDTQVVLHTNKMLC